VSHETYLDRLPAHALGALDDDERRELEDHLDLGCPECERELAGWYRQVELLAELAPPLPPSPHVRARVLRQAGAVDRESSALPRGLLAAAALLLLVAWVGAGYFRARQEVERLDLEKAGLAERLATTEAELGTARARLERMTMAAQILSAPDLHAVRLAGLEAAPGASAHAFIDPASGRAVFYASDLPELALERTYQLWFIADGTPVSAGVFDPGPGGQAAVIVEGVAPIGTIQAWAVTIEPEGGLPQPSGEMVLKGGVGA
jgi:anti-sigma-K factor RskA